MFGIYLFYNCNLILTALKIKYVFIVNLLRKIFLQNLEFLAAQGTFELKDFVVYANTSKPMTLIFPKSGILKSTMNLESWSLEHAK